MKSSAGITLSALLRASGIYAQVGAQLRSRNITSLLLELSDDRAASDQTHLSFQDLQALLTLFARLRVWLYTARNHCLLDSLVLARFLQTYHINATFCIGVALMPFAAHAWVQVETCVLDDSVDHVRNFLPILVV